MTRSVEGTGAQEQKMAEEAKRLGVRVEELAAAAVQDLLARPAPAFQQTASRVLDEKNRSWVHPTRHLRPPGAPSVPISRRVYGTS